MSRAAERVCECSDPGCDAEDAHEHEGERATHCYNQGTRILYRIDQEDHDGTRMCDPCADDAMESGVFSDEPASGQED